MDTPPDVHLNLPPIGTNLTAEDLMAHAESLNAHLQYYMPSFEGIPDFLRPGGFISGSSLSPDLASASQAAHGLGELRATADGVEEATDYGDHLQQPGNTKKRKVPLNMAGFPIAHDHRGADDVAEDSSDRDTLSDGRHVQGGHGIERSSDGDFQTTRLSRRLSRLSLASLRYKELLKARKDQLTSVLNSSTDCNGLVLDEALLSNLPFILTPTGHTRVRLSRRKRLRAMRYGSGPHRTLSAPTPLALLPAPTGEFAFQYHSEASKRYASTRAQVSRLQIIFEAEMTRKAVKAAEDASVAVTVTPLRPKRTECQPQRARTVTTVGYPRDRSVAVSDQSLTTALSNGKKKKKKKRSALANASNPHHLRNYVPSRLPHSGSNTTQTLPNAHAALGPFPFRFLTAEIAPARKSKPWNESLLPTDTEVANEWICPFCEYNLFYGDEHAFRRAIRSRKKILRRRRRAQERAAAAANGKATPAIPTNRVAEEDEEALFEPPHDDVPASITEQMKWKGERNRVDDDRQIDNRARHDDSG